MSHGRVAQELQDEPSALDAAIELRYVLPREPPPSWGARRGRKTTSARGEAGNRALSDLMGRGGKLVPGTVSVGEPHLCMFLGYRPNIWKT